MKEFKINAQQKTPREINRTIKQASQENNRIVIENPNAMHYLVAGLTKPVDVVIDGSAGYFVATMIHGARVHINGNAGWFPADNMTEGEVIIDGSAGDGVGQGIYGGTVVVRRDVGSRTGEIMKNGTIIIGGNSGFMSGLFMMGGRIIILGDISDDAGESIIRGTIYVGGNIQSLGKNAMVEELEEEEYDEDEKSLADEYRDDFSDQFDNLKSELEVVLRAAGGTHANVEGMSGKISEVYLECMLLNRDIARLTSVLEGDLADMLSVLVDLQYSLSERLRTLLLEDFISEDPVFVPGFMTVSAQFLNELTEKMQED